MRSLCAALLLAGTVSAQPAAQPLTVGVFEVPPFAMKGRSGAWHGLHVELWDSLARELGKPYAFREGERDALLSGLSDGSVDVVVGPIAVSMELEKTVDFTHLVESVDLAIASIAATEAERWRSVARAFFSPAFLGVLLALVLILVASGVLVWLFERRHNPAQFGGSPAQGIGSGLWWSIATATTVGYGDKVPGSLGGRVVAVVWMLSSVLVVSGFTAAVTARLAVSHLERVRGPEDLADHVSGTLRGSPSEAWLLFRRFRTRSYGSLEEAFAALKRDEVEAVVGGAHQLEYLASQERRVRVDVMRVHGARQGYAFAIAEGSPLREPLNRALLKVLESPQWRDTEARYLGR